ncbi:hypothetical protein [Haloechinothrix sp. LS1_15]|uniref:hypothetical protein n=1 Tax=Haloechinothrix sp. LS1_15 TaxID=2652248 RepID=UPI00294470F6|nr:hypothetical protein [Haloechinothrix sp. LS1_15]MDV6014769.1 antitoxin [Haloechinothrix sp. LS1_15]
MNVRDVPDDVYDTLVEAARANRRSLSAFVVDRLAEVARTSQLGVYLSSYHPPEGSQVTSDDAVAAVREVRESS